MYMEQTRMPSQTINISLPEELVSQVDKVAKAEYTNRSEFIRQALVKKLKSEQSLQQDWAVLETMMADASVAAAERGYVTDDDFVRAVKEVRSEHLSRESKS
jgi:metal-responsive CopG/Arc/MetJ family transcriptional regulator